MLNSDYTLSICIKESNSKVKYISREEIIIKASIAAYLVNIILNNILN